MSEFFRDFDKLRSYSISKNEFVRGLNQIGESLTPEEFDIIANHYTDPKKNGCCKWINFENDIEKGKENRDIIIPSAVNLTYFSVN